MAAGRAVAAVAGPLERRPHDDEHDREADRPEDQDGREHCVCYAPPPMLRSGSLLAAAAALVSCLDSWAASYPPELRFRSLRGRLATVHYHEPLEPLARSATALADEILASQQARYGVSVGRVQIVLEDTADDPNGLATPFPYPLVRIAAAAPDGSDDFGNHDGWLRLVLTHELAHVVHLSPARGVPGFLRKLLGRAPFLFPNLFTPTWMIEGLATYEETQGTAFGRGRNPDSRMVLRMAAVEGPAPGEDRAVRGLDDWPGGQTPYLFGESFLRDLSEEHGAQALPELARSHSGRLVPFLDDLTARKVTGASFHAQWKEWSAESRSRFEQEAAERSRGPGLAPSRPLTARGIRQTGARFSPDGRLLAYTSSALDRYREIRLVGADGSGDRRLALRNGGNVLAWTPDGRTLVYDEPDSYRLFRTVSDLRTLDVATGRVRWLTRGLRARDPDVAGDGRQVVFVRRLGDRSDLFAISIDGFGLRRITTSPPGTEWSGPRFAPGGGRVAASRLDGRGMLDVVIVDPATGEVTPLTADRAKDVEPTWLPDGSGIVFRSDRDGVSNLYRLRLPTEGRPRGIAQSPEPSSERGPEGSLERLSNVAGGAFAPDVAPDGRSLAFASYSARGYDLRVMDLEHAPGSPAEVFGDPYPSSSGDPVPASVPASPYRALPAALPRFWVPYFAKDDIEWKVGAATGGADPLLRHAYALQASYGTTTERAGIQGVYQYDRLFPTLLLAFEDTTDAGESADLRTQELLAQAVLPLRRTLRSDQSLAFAWRRRRESLLAEAGRRLDFGGIEAAYTLWSARRYPYSISPVDGSRLRLAVLREAPALGSDVSLTKLTGDARSYLRVGRGALALRLGGGATWGEPSFTRSYAIGGFAGNSLLDVVRSNLTVLRGYPDDAFSGRSYLGANAELRLPLGHPQRGWRSMPVFLRHLHAAAFVDAGNAWTGSLQLSEIKSAAGVALGLDCNLAHALPFTFSAGVARGFAAQGDTRFYFRTGLAF